LVFLSRRLGEIMMFSKVLVFPVVLFGYFPRFFNNPTSQFITAFIGLTFSGFL